MTHDSDKNDKLVSVTIAERVFQVKAGPHLVSELEKLAGLGADDHLEEVVGGRLKPLDNGKKVEIHGGEAFVLCGTGAAS